MQLGASFSHRHLKYLGLDPQKALCEFKSLGLKWIRLSVYWDEIEPQKGEFDFTKLEAIIKYCEKHKINVVLTVGMKAQRHPEYYLPYWINGKVKTDVTRKITFEENKELLDAVLKFIEMAVKHFKKYRCLKVWQVENEPLDSSGENWWRLDAKFLKSEVDIVRKLDPKRKILINLWGNELSIRKVYKQTIKLADIVGFDIYLRHPISFWKFFTKYIGPLDSKEKIKQIGKEIKDSGKEFWITELQTEPWEPNELVAKSDNPPSFLPEQLKTNLDYALTLSPNIILLWGFEYWYWRKENGDRRFWEEVKKLRF